MAVERRRAAGQVTQGLRAGGLLGHPGGLWAIEIKRSAAPRVERGFRVACEDLSPERRFVVYPGNESFPMGGDVTAVSVEALATTLAEAAPA